ncbi:cell division control protein 45 homolog isoform X2 [Amyelois transitella]|uniref:cell division control protein 45 homolog isoform X2 n=1 Tax=Amyelois transitella TaxID=680683 RepID=UPI0029902D8E|nr:cell division control protein 45 homolog isoform X2 [Amyelois transitella]
MFIEDLKTDFYDVLLGNRVLLLVHYDVDAICACKILQELFKCDNISYTLVPVGGIAELKTAYEENNEEIKYVVMVNCGGTIDLVDILQPEEDVVFFVLDSHKPTDICNVYSDGQVRLVYKDSEENIPNFDDIFRDDEEEEDQPTDSGMEALEAVVEKRRARRAWEERRHTLMFNYTQFSYFGRPSACVALEVSQLVSRCSVTCAWSASVACTAMEALCARAPALAVLDASQLQRVLAHRQLQEDQLSCHIVIEKDAWLPLYRSWSLEAALRHAPLIGPALKLHTLAGEGRLRQLLADMGYPLSQARQAYRSMDVELRRGLCTALATAAPKLGLPDPTRASFLLRRPHKPPLPALDLVYIIMALIEHDTIPKAEGFQHALSALEPAGGGAAVSLGAAAAQRALAACRKLVAATLGERRLMRAGPFSYFIVPEGCPEAGAVRGPLWLALAARGAAGAAPVLASAPRGPHHALLLGLPPRSQHEPRKSAIYYTYIHTVTSISRAGQRAARPAPRAAAGAAAALPARAAQVCYILYIHTYGHVYIPCWPARRAARTTRCCWGCRRAPSTSRASLLYTIHTYIRSRLYPVLASAPRGPHHALLLGLPPRSQHEPRKSAIYYTYIHTVTSISRAGQRAARPAPRAAAGAAAALPARAAQVCYILYIHTYGHVYIPCWPARRAARTTRCCWGCRRAPSTSRAIYSARRLSRRRLNAARPFPWTFWTRPSSRCRSLRDHNFWTPSQRYWLDVSS